MCPPLQELEQGRHELRLKLEGCQSQWESQVGDLERDVRELSAQVEQLAQALSQAERDKSRAQMEHSDHTQRLKEQLQTVSLCIGGRRVTSLAVTVTNNHLTCTAAGPSHPIQTPEPGSLKPPQVSA